jgi:ABC-2 type transport system permease protein
VAAVTSFVLLLVLWVIGFAGQMAGGKLEVFFKAISLTENTEDFSKGVVDTKNIVFFLTFIALNLFLTQRAVESRRWR